MIKRRRILFWRKKRTPVRFAALGLSLALAGVPIAPVLPSFAAPNEPEPATLKSETIEAYDRYVQLTDARSEEELQGKKPFLHIDALPEAQRRAAYVQLGNEQAWIEKLQMLDNGRAIDCPHGIIHDWVAMVFIPGATLVRTLALMKDYDHHSTYYKPEVERSKLLEHHGDDYKVYLRFRRKKIITVVLNTQFDVHYGQLDAARAYSWSRSTRIAQVDEAGTPQEHEKPVGDDGGYLWRMDTYWRFVERDGGTYVQCEVVSLTRDIPAGFRWLIGPFVNSIPRESLASLLRATRTALLPDSVPH